MSDSLKSYFRYVAKALLLAIIFVISASPASAERHKSKRNKSKKAVVSTPVVHAAMFWMKDCSHCTKIKSEVLPPLQAKYGDQLKIKMLEVETNYDEETLYKIAASHKLEEEETGVPFLMIGNRVLVGDRPIARELPSIIEASLQSGGLPFPDSPVLKAYLEAPRPVDAPPPKSKAREEEANRAGVIMAAVLGIIMIIALLASAFALLSNGSQGKQFLAYSPWPQRLIPVCCMIGLCVAAYLTKVEFSGAAPFCGTVHGCDKVQSSEYAWIIKDILPVGLLGMVGYLMMLVSWLWGTYHRGTLASLMPVILFWITFIGGIYSLYLTWIEIFAIKAACIWCMINADLITLILLCSLPAAIKSRQESGNLKTLKDL